MLFLDDERMPIKVTWPVVEFNGGMVELPTTCWTVVRNYDEFVKHIQENGVPDWVTFDHDLATEKTGYHCARYLIEYCIDNKFPLPERIFFHTMNPIGRDKMHSLFISAKNNFNFL